ncbi:MAG: hypothetical protein EZS28_047386 [Streblomastix strix]|uniref:SUN domain-containing protein n=1 Tax=Streblomastix strix TaxID=222440 RepID=A0A5J4TFY3_9EUKA|nr:MAG: hypothetical protein EZS28_047386 [Streblomastix strix]
MLFAVLFVVALILGKNLPYIPDKHLRRDATKVMHEHNSNHNSTSLPNFASHQQNAVIPCNKSGGYDIAMYYSSVIGYVDINTSTSVIIRGAYSYRTIWESDPDEYQILHLSFGILTLENIEFQFSETRTTLDSQRLISAGYRDDNQLSLTINKCIFQSKYGYSPADTILVHVYQAINVEIIDSEFYGVVLNLFQYTQIQKMPQYKYKIVSLQTYTSTMKSIMELSTFLDKINVGPKLQETNSLTARTCRVLLEY